MGVICTGWWLKWTALGSASVAFCLPGWHHFFKIRSTLYKLDSWKNAFSTLFEAVYVTLGTPGRKVQFDMSNERSYRTLETSLELVSPCICHIKIWLFSTSTNPKRLGIWMPSIKCQGVYTDMSYTSKKKTIDTEWAIGPNHVNLDATPKSAKIQF